MADRVDRDTASCIRLATQPSHQARALGRQLRETPIQTKGRHGPSGSKDAGTRPTCASWSLAQPGIKGNAQRLYAARRNHGRGCHMSMCSATGVSLLRQPSLRVHAGVGAHSVRRGHFRPQHSGNKALLHRCVSIRRGVLCSALQSRALMLLGVSRPILALPSVDALGCAE